MLRDPAGLRRLIALELRQMRRTLRSLGAEPDPRSRSRMQRLLALRRVRIARGYARLRLIGAG